MPRRRRLSPSDRSERLQLPGLGSGVPGFAIIGRRSYRTARHPVSPHRHPGILEINYLARGQQLVQAGAHCWLLRGNQLLVIPPGETHGTAGQPAEHCTLYWLGLELVPGERFLAAEGPEAAALAERLLALAGSVLAAPPWLRQAFDEVIHLHGQSDPLRRLRLTHLLTRVVLGIVDAACPQEPPKCAPAVRLAQQHVRAHLGEPLRIGELADAAGISPTRLSVLFKRDLAMTPREYVLREKVAGSKRLLQDPARPITAIAHTLGFSSSQYYATVFRRFTGMSPGEYRRLQHRPGPTRPHALRRKADSL